MGKIQEITNIEEETKTEISSIKRVLQNVAYDLKKIEAIIDEKKYRDKKKLLKDIALKLSNIATKL